MKRLLFIAVIWGVALLPLSADAQRSMGAVRGGGTGGRMGGAVNGRPVGGGFGARPMAPPRMGGGFVGRPMPGFSGGTGPRQSVGMVSPRARGFTGSIFIPRQRGSFGRRGFAFDSFRFRRGFSNAFLFNSCFNGFGCNGFFGNPFFGNGFFGNGFFGTGLWGGGWGLPYYLPYYDPYLYGGYGYGGYGNGGYGYGYGNGGYAPQQQQPVVVEGDTGNRELALEVQELSDSVRGLRDEERASEETRSRPSAPATSEEPRKVVLVFRDGHQITVQNYAITGHTLWILSEHTAKKVPLSELNLPATQEENAKRGIEFQVPKGAPL
jgi:hypothetical protein